MVNSIVNDPKWKSLLANGIADQTIEGVGKVMSDGAIIVYGNNKLVYRNDEWEKFGREHDASMWCEEGHDETSRSTLAVYKNILGKN